MTPYSVYILTNRSRTLYVGVANDLDRRLAAHRAGTGSRCASHYRVDRLVWVEPSTDIRAAITREKQIMGWTRARKIALIEAGNPEWRDPGAW